MLPPIARGNFQIFLKDLGSDSFVWYWAVEFWVRDVWFAICFRLHV